jgi:hypothetical protein
MKKLSKTLQDVTNCISNELSTAKVVKLYLPHEIRKFKIKTSSFQEFIHLIQVESRSKRPTLQYLDDEQDWVTFSSEMEFEAALSASSVSNKNIFRVRVKGVVSDEAPSGYSNSIHIRNLPQDFFGIPMEIAK